MKRLVSERKYIKGISFDVVKEWENIFCEHLNTRIYELHFNIFIRIWNRAILYHIPFTTNKKKWRIGFVFSAGSDRPFRMKNVIPIYVDFHPRVMDKVIKDTRKLPCWFVTSKELCTKIREISSYNNCFFVPLSLADNYIQRVNVEKNIDVIQMGRKNKILHEYMLHYCCENPEVNYVYMEDEESKEYVSTTWGYMGKIEGREQYFEFLRSAKISLVSSPGMDQSSRRYDESVDFFTPRFYESAAARCFMIGRYSENAESDQIGIKRICINVKKYNDFKQSISRCLKDDIRDYESMYLEFLNNNCTSKRLEYILDVMKEKGFVV